MRKIVLLSFLLSVLTANTAAQSGRRSVSPPPPREPIVESPTVVSQPERMSPVVEMTVLPEDIANRELRSVDQGSFRLSDFSGKVVVINLWATWCGPCRREVPDYEKVRKNFAGKPVEFIGLTAEDPRTASERVKQFARDFNFGFRLGWIDRETEHILMNGRSLIPQTIVIGTDGRIIAHWNGYSSGQSRSRLHDTIERALAGKP